MPVFPVLILALVGQAFLSRTGNPLTLWPGLLFYGLALWKLRGLSSPSPAISNPLPLKIEILLAALILGLGFFLRVYRLDSMPSGMHTDQGLTGLCALRILHEGWRPFGELLDYEVPEILLFYQLAGWFGLVGSSYFTFHLFFILLSLAAFPLVYWAIRQWSGQRTALFSLFLLAVMRWNWIETRNGYPSLQVPFYLFGAIAFWSHWLQSGKKWAFYLSALFVSAGFYTYQAFKIVPLLMVVFSFYELVVRKRKNMLRPILIYFLLVLALTAPLLACMWSRGNIGHREKELFIGTEILRQKSLEPLWDVWTGTALMFNRSGDRNPRHNIPGHRMLDDSTAILFVLGLALLWRKRREPSGFYSLWGFWVMALPGLLSTDVSHSNRLVALTPFAAYFAGSALDFFWQKAGAFRGSRIPAVLLYLLLGIIASQNARTYFADQAGNEECWRSFGVEQTYIGRTLEDLERHVPGGFYYYIEPFYYKNHTVDFLGYSARGNMSAFSLAALSRGRLPADKDSIFLLGEDKAGTLDFLQLLFPMGQQTGLRDALGHTLVYVDAVAKETFSSYKPWDRGLKGVYIQSGRWKARPLVVRWDALLNFGTKWEFPFTAAPPFRIRWDGSLTVPRKGNYQFQVLTTDRARLSLDNKPILLEKPVSLRTGSHPIRLEFEKDQGSNLAVHLIWEKPGDKGWEMVPASAFGKITQKK